MQTAIRRFFDIDQEIRKIVAEFRATVPEVTELPRPGAPTKPHHRLNRDGTIDSICTRCFATIASSYRVEDLEPVEQAHVCDAEALRRYYKRFS